MITIVLIIAVAIIAVLTAYGWWKTNERIDYEVQCRCQDYKMFCETIDTVDDLPTDIARIMRSLDSANDRIKIVTSRLDDIGYQVESIDNARKANLKDLKELIDARHDYLHDRLLTHCHAYNVENNTLYIQNPLWIDNTKEPKAIEKNEEG